MNGVSSVCVFILAEKLILRKFRDMKTIFKCFLSSMSLNMGSQNLFLRKYLDTKITFKWFSSSVGLYMNRYRLFFQKMASYINYIWIFFIRLDKLFFTENVFKQNLQLNFFLQCESLYALINCFYRKCVWTKITFEWFFSSVSQKL